MFAGSAPAGRSSSPSPLRGPKAASSRPVINRAGRHIYWANDFGIGRANLDGTDVNQNFIAVPDGPSGVSGLAVNSRYIYWSDETAGTIGRANLDGTDVNQQFITGASFPEGGLTVDSRYIYWVSHNSSMIGRANLDGTDVNQSFIAIAPSTDPIQIGPFGLAVDPGQE
jgi:virginiamycin B lyase